MREPDLFTIEIAHAGPRELARPGAGELQSAKEVGGSRGCFRQERLALRRRQKYGRLLVIRGIVGEGGQRPGARVADMAALQGGIQRGRHRIRVSIDTLGLAAGDESLSPSLEVFTLGALEFSVGQGVAIGQDDVKALARNMSGFLTALSLQVREVIVHGITDGAALGRGRPTHF